MSTTTSLPLEILRQTWDLFFPPACLVCRRPLRCGEVCTACLPQMTSFSGQTHCHGCGEAILCLERTQVPPCCPLCSSIPSIFRSQRHLWSYRDCAQELLIALKYRPSLRLARVTAGLAATELPLYYPELLTGHPWTAIVPVPSNPRSLHHRGFEPSIIVATAIARRYQIPVHARALRFVGTPKNQATLDHRERIRNVRGAFSCSLSNLRGAPVLLVDDVATTGATLAAAGTALRKAGAGRIDVFTVARSEHWQDFRWLIHNTPW